MARKYFLRANAIVTLDLPNDIDINDDDEVGEFFDNAGLNEFEIVDIEQDYELEDFETSD